MASFNRVLGTMAFSPNSKIEASLHHFTTGDCFLAGIHCYLPFASLLFDWTGPADIVPKRSGDCEGSSRTIAYRSAGIGPNMYGSTAQWE